MTSDGVQKNSFLKHVKVRNVDPMRHVAVEYNQTVVFIITKRENKFFEVNERE